MDPADKRSWSGIYYYMAQALRKYCGSVSFLGPVYQPQSTMRQKMFNKCSQIFSNKKYNYDHGISLAKKYGKVFSQKLSQQSFDYIFAPAASAEIAFLNTDIPIIYSSDTTFSLLNEYYPYLSNLLSRSIREGNLIESRAIHESNYLLYPSQWAADSAVRDYKCDPAKVHVIPYGANIDQVPPLEMILDERQNDLCRLLFLAVDWERKGGEIAFETLLELQRAGVPSELIICGCVPPKEISHKSITVIPYLNKNDPVQSKQLEDLLLKSSFLLLPTRQECYGIVFCEASAYGLPSISTATGGVPIENGVNGFLLPPEARGAAYAGLIWEIFADKERYRKLVVSSRERYDAVLNWDAWGSSAEGILKEKRPVPERGGPGNNPRSANRNHSEKKSVVELGGENGLFPV